MGLNFTNEIQMHQKYKDNDGSSKILILFLLKMQISSPFTYGALTMPNITIILFVNVTS